MKSRFLIVGVLLSLVSLTTLACSDNTAEESKKDSGEKVQTKSDKDETPKEFDTFLSEIDYELIYESNARICSTELDKCFDGNSIIVKMDKPVREDFIKIANVVVREKWTANGNQIFTKKDVEELVALTDDDEGTNDVGLFSFFNLGLFGDKTVLLKGDRAAYFFGFDKESIKNEGDPTYIVRSEVPTVVEDWDSIIAQLGDGSYMLSITIGK